VVDDRYSRQAILSQIGKVGQRKLAKSSLLLVGCGATGGNMASLLVRAGVGRLVILDRDVVERSNLHRQVLFEEDDVGSPKAYQAAERLHRINKDCKLEGLAEDFSPSNAERLVGESDLVLDGSDNLETRYVLNDACVKTGKPWVYVGAVATYGMKAFISPGRTACFRCFLPKMPGPGAVTTCATAGVLNTIPAVMGAMGATEAVKFLVGQEPAERLVMFDIWSGEYNSVSLTKREDCPCCGQRKFDFLDVPAVSKLTVMCGSGSVQITPPPHSSTLDLLKMAVSLRELGNVDGHGAWLTFNTGKYRLTIFKNGRVLISGTSDEKTARALYSKYIGN
jgi:molybdopterin/thiamine biosynthesis adenylyltransferase